MKADEYHANLRIIHNFMRTKRFFVSSIAHIFFVQPAIQVLLLGLFSFACFYCAQYKGGTVTSQQWNTDTYKNVPQTEEQTEDQTETDRQTDKHQKVQRTGRVKGLIG